MGDTSTGFVIKLFFSILLFSFPISFSFSLSFLLSHQRATRDKTTVVLRSRSNFNIEVVNDNNPNHFYPGNVTVRLKTCLWTGSCHGYLHAEADDDIEVLNKVERIAVISLSVAGVGWYVAINVLVYFFMFSWT